MFCGTKKGFLKPKKDYMHIHDYFSLSTQNENLYPTMKEEVKNKVFKINLTD